MILRDTNENIEAKVDEERNCVLLTVIIAKNEQWVVWSEGGGEGMPASAQHPKSEVNDLI